MGTKEYLNNRRLHLKDRKSPKVKLFLLTTFLCIAGTIWIQWGQIFFYLNEERYQVYKKPYSEYNEAKINKLLADLKSLLSTFPDDSLLLYYSARLKFWKIMNSISIDDPILRIVITNYISGPSFPDFIDRNIWQECLIKIRKSLRLGIDKRTEIAALSLLGDIYAIGGQAYWEKGRKLNLGSNMNKPISQWSNLFNIGIPSANFQANKLTNSKDSAKLIKAIHFLYINNTPLAISRLNYLSNSNNSKISSLANLLLGHRQYSRKNYYAAWLFWRKINPSLIFEIDKNFSEKYIFVLRFLGKRNEVNQFIKKMDGLG